MTAADFVTGFALIPLAVGVIVAAEKLRPTMGPKRKKEKLVTSVDSHLRECGWKIYCRPRSGKDKWEWRHGPGVWFQVDTAEAVAVCPLVLGGWERTSKEDRGERVWILRGKEGNALLVMRQSDAIAQAARIMAKYADQIAESESR